LQLLQLHFEVQPQLQLLLLPDHLAPHSCVLR
jgi:hypothetical protein